MTETIMDRCGARKRGSFSMVGTRRSRVQSGMRTSMPPASATVLTRRRTSASCLRSNSRLKKCHVLRIAFGSDELGPMTYR